MSTIQTTTKYNTADFPILGSEMTQKKGRKLPIEQLGFTSHIDDLRKDKYRRDEYRRDEYRRDDGRTKAYEQLQDKELMAKRLTKTRLCWSVQKGVPCPHGDDKCKFAHTHEELTLAPCLFGMKCRFVRWSDQTGEYSNSGSKTCGYQHPEETRAGCMCRTGIDQIVLQVSKKRSNVMKTPTKLVPSQVIPNAPRKTVWGRSIDPEEDEVETTIVNMQYKDEVVSDQLSESDDEVVKDEVVKDEVVKDEVETTIVNMQYKDEVVSDQLSESDDEEWEENEEATFSVPEDLAVDALIAAMEEGKKRITICIV